MPPVNAPLTADAPMQVPVASVDFQGQKGNSFEGGLGVNINPSNNVAPMNSVNAVVASQANVVIANELENGDTVDGVVLATGNLVLLKAQTDPKENGVYVVPAAGAASRSTSFGAYGLTYHRLPVKVLGGTDAGKTFLQATRGTIVIGTTNIVFEQFAGQLEHQANILDATKEAMNRQNVKPLNSTPHPRWTDGILTYDNQVMEGYYPKGNVRLATTAAHALSGLAAIDGVTPVAGDRILVKNGTSSPSLYTGVQAATTANIADLANAAVLQDGVTLVETDRLLVKDQTDPKDNGIYVVGVVALGVAPLTRALDMDAVGEVVLGKGVTVDAGGTLNGGKTFAVSAVPAALGVNPLTFALSSLDLVAAVANGIYVAAAGAWSRSTDADTSAEVRNGMTVFVLEGTANGEKSFFISTPNPITLNATPIAINNITEVLTENLVNQPTDTLKYAHETGAYRSL